MTLYLYGVTGPANYDLRRLDNFAHTNLAAAHDDAMSTRNLLTILGDYWTQYFSDTELLKSAYSGMTTLLSDDFLRTLKKVIKANINNVTYSDVGTLNLFVFDASKARFVKDSLDELEYVAYTVPKLAHVTAFSDTLFEPSVVLEKGAYFEVVEIDSKTSEIRFYVNIFQDPSIVQASGQIEVAKRVVLLWGTDVIYKERLVYERYGRFLYASSHDTVAYQFMVMALQKYYVSAKTPKGIEDTLNVLLGMPYARQHKETVLSVEEIQVDSKAYTQVVTDVNTYTMPGFAQVQVSAGDVLKRLDLIGRIAFIRDYISDPAWYRESRFPAELILSSHAFNQLYNTPYDGNWNYSGDLVDEQLFKYRGALASFKDTWEATKFRYVRGKDTLKKLIPPIISDPYGTEFEQLLYDLMDKVLKYNVILFDVYISEEFDDISPEYIEQVFTWISSGLPVYLYPMIQYNVGVLMGDVVPLFEFMEEGFTYELEPLFAEALVFGSGTLYNGTFGYSDQPLLTYGGESIDATTIKFEIDTDRPDWDWEDFSEDTDWAASEGQYTAGAWHPELAGNDYRLVLQAIGLWPAGFRPVAIRILTQDNVMATGTFQLLGDDATPSALTEFFEYVSGSEMPIVFASGQDIGTLVLTSKQAFVVTAVEFLIDNVPPM